uniref:RRM domain-containing protein n=1 Tax=Angiostrongylus cantonensis TaxID=6313 RepID=A0A0K0DII3_ANGCA
LWTISSDHRPSGRQRCRKVSRINVWSQPRADEEHEELQKALRKFEDDFGSLGGGALDRGPKAFIRSEVVNANKTVSSGKELYKPEPIVNIHRSLPVSGSSFEESKRLAAEKARRMLEEAHKGKGPPPQVIPSSATRPVLRPPKPGAGRAVQKSKTSNLEAFKEELKKVQQERDQRKGLRDHLRAELGVDAEALDKSVHGFLVQIFLLRHFYLRICSMTMEDLFDTFGSFGPLASAKILFPRTEEEKRREHLCGFCAFMSREDVDRALAQMMGFFIRGEPIRMSFAKPIVIPAQPFYVPPPLLDLSAPDPITELPFNAKPLLRDKQELYVLSTLTACDNIVLWSFSHLLLVIQHVVEFTVREGPLFEAMLMTRERTNPLFRFLFELNHPTHVYYRWRLYSISQGDTFLEWHREKFRMFEGGSWWQPPIPQAELFSSMPRSLYSFACTITEPSRWLPKLDVPKTRTSSKSQDTRERQDRSRSSPRREQLKKPKARLRKSQRKKLEQLLRELTPESDSIGDAMVWCADHATCAREICDCIYESLTIDETPLHKKIARLYLISDLLANAASRGVRDVFYFRQYFGDLLSKIFSALGRTLRNITARLKAEQFKQRVMSCFR